MLERAPPQGEGAERRHLGRRDGGEHRGHHRGVGAGRDRAKDQVEQRGEGSRDQERVDADLASVAGLEVLTVLSAGQPHDRHQEQQEERVGRPRAEAARGAELDPKKIRLATPNMNKANAI